MPRIRKRRRHVRTQVRNCNVWTVGMFGCSLNPFLDPEIRRTVSAKGRCGEAESFKSVLGIIYGTQRC